MFTITSKEFDLAASGLAITSYLRNWSFGGEIGKSLLRGVQYFALASGVDRLARFVLGGETPQVLGFSPLRCALSACVGEGLFAGLLLTRNVRWMVPRCLLAMATGVVAAQALSFGPSANDSLFAFSLDAKIGITWAVARESLSWASSNPLPFLIAGDTVVLGIVGGLHSPTGEVAPLPLNKGVVYRIVSAGLFRAIADCAASTTGLVAAITQRFLLDFSRTLP